MPMGIHRRLDRLFAALRTRSKTLLCSTATMAALAFLVPHAANGAVTVPVRLRGVYIYVDVVINGRPATFVLDTGASANVVTPDAIKRLHLTPGQEQTPLTGAAGPAGSVPHVKMDTLVVGSDRARNQIAYVIPLPDELACDGLLGTPFLQKRVVTLDYERSQLTISGGILTTAPAGASAIPLRFYGNTPFVEAIADGCKGWFRMDTGAGNGATLFAAFAEHNHLQGKYMPSVRLVTGRGVGGLLYGDLVRLPELDIGPFKFTGAVTELSRQTEGTFGDRQNAGNLGGEIWQRFTVVLDYARSRAYLSPNGRLDMPFNTPRSGLAVEPDQGKNAVRDVIPDSPASEAGIVVGDVVTQVEGVPMDQIKAWDLAAILRREPGTKVRLRLRSRGGVERDVVLVLRDLL